MGLDLAAEPAVVDRPAAASPPGLRLRLAGLAGGALTEPDDLGDAWDRFIAEPDAGDSLRGWFGADMVAEWRRSRTDLETIGRAIDRDIAWIDRLLNDQVNAILHAPRFQQLEASWRGLVYLVRQGENDDRVKIRLLDVSWAELCRDLDRAIEFDQSTLFHKVYTEEFGMPGGEPYGILVGDYAVQHRRSADHPTDDVAALKAASQVAAAAFSPLIVGASPVMFGLDSFTELGVPIDLEGTFRQPEYLRWRSFQETEDARFVGITAPRILMRLPYRDDTRRTDGFRFTERVDAPNASGYLWGNAAYAFAAVVIRAYSSYGWFADIRGSERDALTGGLVTDLPVMSFGTDAAGIAIKISTDVSIGERQEMELAGLGFIPLSKAKDTDYSVFYSNQSVQRPKRYDRSPATMNAQLSAMLQYILCVSRFSQYIKVIGRDRIGRFSTPEECQDLLYRWLMSYSIANPNASMEQKARYPLSEVAVQVRERPGSPGEFLCTAHLKPHFQLDQVVSSFQLVTELNPAKA